MTEPRRRFLGITMRRMETVDHHDPRDALSIDWYLFVAAVLPEFTLLLLPNSKTEVAALLEGVPFAGLLLTGGNDIGTCADRDESERLIMSYATATAIPLFGVCRGLQSICAEIGIPLTPDIVTATDEEHVACVHEVTLNTDLCDTPIERQMVNSFHDQGILLDDIPSGCELEVFATSAGGVVEGIMHRDRPLTGVQWHPEREDAPRQLDRLLMRRLFLGEDGE